MTISGRLLPPATDESVRETADRLTSIPGVRDAEVVIASLRVPEYIPTEQYFSGGGPSYQPPPQTDTVDGWACPAFLCGMVPTAAYQWWANNIGTPQAALKKGIMRGARKSVRALVSLP